MATDMFDCDVLVIGSGASGMATAITAASGLTILLVEQITKQALGVADRAYGLETGTVTLEASGRELLADPKVKAAYLGAH
jgi:ABC-type branched-subunit amino acid transport system ATPase component